MNRDDQKVDQVTSKLDGSAAPTGMTVEVELTSRRVGGPDPVVPIEELERNLDIARGRYFYASQKSDYWQIELRKRSNDLSEALIAYTQKKHNLTDYDLEKKNWSHDVYGVFEKKK